MSNPNIDTKPNIENFNLIHSDGRVFDELQYMRDQVRAYRGSALFTLRQAQSYGLSADYHLEQYHRFKVARLQALIDAGELTMMHQRLIAAGKALKAKGVRN